MYEPFVGNDPSEKSTPCQEIFFFSMNKVQPGKTLNLFINNSKMTAVQGKSLEKIRKKDKL